MDSHEIAAKERADKFVGRIELRQQIYDHCRSENVEDNTMVVNGWMGNGKTSLMAYVANKCLEHLRTGGDFVFLYIVDSCLGSNILLNMLQRLHQKLSLHIGVDNPLATPTDLKSLHAARLEEVAKNNPNKKFVIIVDAVNQFSSRMEAHSMWWLPSHKAPMNLRVVISTLWDTGDTFQNALKRCPKAVQVEVPDEMLEEDCKEMVLAILKRHNMEITTENKDPRVGNQMEKLLNKNRGPLYLNAAIEGMRRGYIENLPLTTEELFEKLLDSWAGDFGWELFRWLMTIIAVSRDGVKKSMLIDLLAFVENKYSRIAFKHSLETVLDFIRGFLSSETHDNVRFFHEELSQVVLEKYGKGNYEPEVRNILIQFFLNHIKEHTSEECEKYVPYYEDCLSEVVFHQTQIRMFAQDWNRVVPQVSTYGDTLKNIFFIKEKIIWNQQAELLNNFRDTTCIRMEEEERTSLSEWERFTHFNWPYIKEFPQWSYALAVNQPNNNAVAMDTRALATSDLSGDVETFPLTWLNKPDTSDQSGNLLRFVGEKCWSCCVSTAGHKLVAYGCNQKTLICNQTTGDIVHQMKVRGSAHTVHFSPTGAALWVGNNHGEITVWNTQTGEQEHNTLFVCQGDVTMIEHINDRTVVCGTGGFKTDYPVNTIGTISLIDTVTYSITNSWSTQLPCVSYCYHAGGDVILSGHNKVIICWNVKDGSEVKRFKLSDSEFNLYVTDMCAHKNRPVIVFVIDTQFAGEIKTLDLTTGECNTIVAESGRYIAQFDHTGDNIICASANDKTIQIYDLSGTLLNTIRIHGGYVNIISPLPHPSSFVSAGDDGGKLHIASTTPVVENTTQVVTWCELLPNNKEFVTLSEDGEVSVYDVPLLELRGSVMVKFGNAGEVAAVHPSGEFMLVCTWEEMCVVDLYNVEIVNVCRLPEYEDATIKCVQFTPSGDKCIILTYRHGTHVYKAHNMYTFEHLLTYTEIKDEMNWCDVTERQCVSGGNSGIVLWDIDSGETLKVLRTEHVCRYVKVLNYLPRGRILYHIWESAPDGKKDEICIIDMDGHDVKRFNTKVDGLYPRLHIFDNHLITAESDGSLRLHDLHTGEVSYVFVDEQSLGFNAFLDNPVTSTITCYNGNGRSYIFEKTFV